MEVDFIIVGQGLAGTSVSQFLKKENQKILIYDLGAEKTSSKVAAGLCNPITGQRQILTWLAADLFPFAHKYYKECEEYCGTSFFDKRKIYRPFLNVTDENDMITKTAIESYKPFMGDIQTNSEFDGLLKSNMGGVEYLNGARLNCQAYLEDMRTRFIEEGELVQEDLVIDDLVFLDQKVQYKNVVAKAIIFCEGIEGLNNPYFNYLPFQSTKGDLLVIEVDGLPEEKIISRGCFIIPKGNKQFLVGSTYHKQLDMIPAEKGREEVLTKLNKVLNLPYKVIDHYVGIRPTVADRKPFLGKHPEIDQLYVFNGLGTKGVTLSPFFGLHLVEYILHGKELLAEVNVLRYNKKFFSQN